MLPGAKIAGADLLSSEPSRRRLVVSPQPFETQYLSGPIHLRFAVFQGLRDHSSKFQYGIPLDLRATILTMVKILPFFLATLAAISPVAQAAAKPATCTPGLDYCGSVLIKSKGSGKEAHLKLKLNRHDQGLTLFSLRLVGKGC
ncbi:hypothetical protein E4U10_000792 [Claviceps purpurea]|nr:hypothetical protein E4U10_000792 [Claviceps purpurea]